MSYKSIVEATRVLFFFATPHQGGHYASVGDVAATLVRSVLRTPENDLLEALKRQSDKTAGRFEQSRHLPEKCLVVSFFESLPFGKLGIVCFPIMLHITLYVNPSCADRRQEVCYS